MMENLQVYFDMDAGVYRLLDDTEEDSGVEDLPFTSYKFGEDTQHSAQMLLDSDGHVAWRPDMDAMMDDQDLQCTDTDYKDADYKPNQSYYTSKKVKTSKHQRKLQYNKENNPCDMTTVMFTPKKQTGPGLDYEAESDSSLLRHYARKDRTPRTILQMMQKHRESERVRHHSLNQAMKEVCMRVPGYNPNAKETKVIQMQRIIGYECLLENTLRDLCSQLDISTRHLHINSHFITDAIRETPLDEFYKPSNYKMSDIEDEDFDNIVLRKRRLPRTSSRQTLNMGESYLKYRREKISSPTVDSTTDNVCQFYPSGNIVNMAASQIAESSQESSFPSCQISNMSASETAESSEGSCPTPQNFRLIIPSQALSSQESGIKVEPSSPEFSVKAVDDRNIEDEIETLIDRGLCHEPEHLKSVTASFMREEPTTTCADDDTCGFDLSSPVRASQVFMCSPRSTGAWFSGASVDTPHGKEMQTVSPENILETIPKPADSTDYPTSQDCPAPPDSPCIPVVMETSKSHRSHEEKEAGPVSDSVNDCFVNSTQRCARESQTSAVVHTPVTVTSYESGHVGAICTVKPDGKQSALPKVYFQKGGDMNTPGVAKANKRSHIVRVISYNSGTAMGLSPASRNKRKRYLPQRSACIDMADQYEGSDGDEPLVVRRVRRDTARQAGNLTVCTSVVKTTNCNKGDSVDRCTSDPIQRVDYRRSTWMNGFMMFCQINRAKFVSANPGVNNSQIQRVMANVWRTMSQQEQAPYEEKAFKCSNYVNKLQQTSPVYIESYTASSTTGQSQIQQI